MAEAHREAEGKESMSTREHVYGYQNPDGTKTTIAATPGPFIPVRKDERTEAIRENTRALLELAQAIREHAYLTAPEEDEDDEPRTYMDGTPVQ